jgi:predicted dienelactone hydrolase
MKRVTYWVLTAVLACAVVSVGSPQAPAQQLGSFAVGHSTRILNVYGTHGEIRPVNVHLWYPAHIPDNCQNSGNSSGNGNDQGCPVTPSVYTSRLYGTSLLPTQWHALSWTIGSSVSFENLPIDTGYSPFPVIIFSHGNQNNAIDYVYTLEALASFGFIVAAPDHLNNTQDDVLIDYINSQASLVGFTPPILPCFDGIPWTTTSPCSHTSVPESMVDRVRDIGAIINALPIWFGDRVDVSRVGVMGHSRGTVTALAAAGGSATWGISPDSRVKAVMGLAIGAQAITLAVNLQNVTVPALLVAGTLDLTTPPSGPYVSQLAFNMLGSTEKNFVLIDNAKHRHFDSGLCAQTQSSGAVAAADPSAILDRQTIRTIVTFPISGTAMDFCELETFTSPSDIRTLVTSLTTTPTMPGFNFTTTPVPTTGLDSAEVKEQVLELAVLFFGHVL